MDEWMNVEKECFLKSNVILEQIFLLFIHPFI